MGYWRGAIGACDGLNFPPSTSPVAFCNLQPETVQHPAATAIAVIKHLHNHEPDVTHRKL